ncbi:MAG TPA: hypothetical protein VFT32_11830 [Candidatus Eisenbacteria bacterium]|nr:hypothetical protein [Candidatus Eisenbacteria bacterium]
MSNASRSESLAAVPDPAGASQYSQIRRRIRTSASASSGFMPPATSSSRRRWAAWSSGVTIGAETRRR